MKSLLQTVGAIVVIVGLVASITFIYQMTTREDTTRPPGPATSDAKLGLMFPEISVETGAEYPLRTDGHYDFWFQNVQSRPVELGLFQVNCGCGSVEAAVLAADSFAAPGDWMEFQPQMPTAAAALIGAGPPQSAPSVVAPAVVQWTRMHQFLRDKLRWQKLAQNQFLSVPPQSTGLVRLTWHGNLTEPTEVKTLAAMLWTRDSNDSVPTPGPKLSVPVAFVLPISFEPPSMTISVNEISQGETGRAEFKCWSTTHSRFSIEPVAESEFVEVKTPRPLSPTELQDLADAIDGRRKRLKPDGAPENKEEPVANRTTVLSGYAITVSVHERLPSGKQLELGPFQSQISFKGGILGIELPPLAVTGVVRGEVTVTAPGERGEQRDRISLGSFPTERGRQLTATITTTQPGLDVKIVGLEPEQLKEYLEVHLQPVPGRAGESTREWELVLRVPPDRLEGKLPPHSVVILQTQGTSSRRVRIPIMGHAYVRGR
jgi:hypothetical protein